MNNKENIKKMYEAFARTKKDKKEKEEPPVAYMVEDTLIEVSKN